MSALDRAFIKAYAKDTPAAAASPLPDQAVLAAAAALTAGPARAREIRHSPASGSAGSHVIDQIYRDGALYRVEMPAAKVEPRGELPAPHFQLPPRSSPRRNVRRLVLKLLSPEIQPEPQEPVHSPAAPARRQTRSTTSPTRQELAPEAANDGPQAEPLPGKGPPAMEPIGPTPTAPPTPLNQTPAKILDLPPTIDIQGHWYGDSSNEAPPSAAALVVVPEAADLQLTEPAPLVELRLDSLPQRDPLASEANVPMPESEPAAATFRLDPPHAEAAGRPHAKFTPVTDGDQPQAAADRRQPAVAEQTETSTGVTLSFADLEPSAAEATIAAATERVEQPCIPVWEVDRFQWPVTVERLVSAKGGYFGQAGERLVAAVGDGLRTLAVTGSRRGEGRTTLALCLARAAAKAGIQVAILDADFARPQLAARIGLEITHGWQDAATGLIPLSEAAVKSLSDQMTVLPLEGASGAGQLSLADPRVTATLRAATATFELVIVDLGPLAAAEEPLFPADEACPFDAAIVVRDLRWAATAESESVGEQLYAAGVEAVGVAENFAPAEEEPATSA